MAEHALVDGTGTQTAAYEQDGLLFRVKAETADSVLTGDGGVEECLAHGVACEDDLLSREEPFHTFVGHTDFLRFLGQQLVGDTRIGVLFLDEAGDTHGSCLVERRTAGIATHAYCHLRTEVFDDLLGHALTLPYLIEHLDVLQQVLAIETADRQSLDLITRSRNTLHLHSSDGTYKEDLRIRTHGFDSIGNGYCGEDVTSRAASTDNDS